MYTLDRDQWTSRMGRTLRDREVPGLIPVRGTANFLEQEIYLRLLLSTQVNKWVRVRELSQCAMGALLVPNVNGRLKTQ